MARNTLTNAFFFRKQFVSSMTMREREQLDSIIGRLEAWQHEAGV